MGRRLGSRIQAVRLPIATAHRFGRSRRAGAPAAANLEPLETRRLLSVAPVAADDTYEFGPDGKLSVDVTTPSPIPENPLPPPLAFDESRFVEPTGPYTTRDFARTVAGGRVVTEPDWVELGEQSGTFGEVTVRDPGSRWVVSNWLEAGERGKGTISVSSGGEVNIRNWSTIGANASGSTGGGGIGLVTVTGAGSRWTSNNWVNVGYQNSWGTLRLLDHARMDVNGSPATASSGIVYVGRLGNASGLLEILDGSALRHNDWFDVGSGGARGDVRVAGGGLLASGGFATIGTNGLGTVTVSGADSNWTVANWLAVGQIGGRGVVRLDGGGNVTVNNRVALAEGNGADGRILVGNGSTFSYRDYMTIGQSLARTARGTLYVAEGGRVVTSGGLGFGNGPEILNASGGRILGGGSIQGKVTNGGFLSPGGSVGVLTIDGSLLQPAATTSTPLGTGANGTLQFDIGGTARGTGYDGLDVSGAATIAGGKVVLNFVNGFAPHAGDRFTLIDAASGSSAPQSVEVRGLAQGFQYTLAMENGDLVLVAGGDATSAPSAVQRKGVLANDADADGDRLTAILVKRPEHGTVTLYSDGSFSYAVGAGFTGDDSFQYKADDGVFESNVATVRLHQDQPAPPNQAPVAVDDTYSTDEDTPLSVVAADGVLKNDTDDALPAPPAALSASLVTGPARGTLRLNPDGSFVYTPNANFSGVDSFTYRAGDGSAESAPAKVTLNVRRVNDAPTANADSKTTRQGVALTFPASELTANDTDPDRGDTVTVTGVSATPATHGAVSLANGIVTYTPDRRYAGPASFNYTIGDGHGGTATGTVNVTVTPRRTGTPGAAMGRGSLNGRRQTFSFMLLSRAAGRDGDLAIMGMLGFEDKAARVVLRSTDVTRFEIDATGRKVTIAGAATVNGRPGYAFEATAEDRSSSGSNDRFRIKITGPEGGNFAYDSKGGSGGSDRIDRGGNITILGTKKKERGDE